MLAGISGQGRPRGRLGMLPGGDKAASCLFACGLVCACMMAEGLWVPRPGVLGILFAVWAGFVLSVLLAGIGLGCFVGSREHRRGS